MTKTKETTVNHPHYYNIGKIEVIDFIEDQGLNFNEGNVVKYLCRAGFKDDALTDLRKAEWYLQREIQRLEKAIQNAIENEH